MRQAKETLQISNKPFLLSSKRNEDVSSQEPGVQVPRSFPAATSLIRHQLLPSAALPILPIPLFLYGE
jgi:hypothetical protein